MNSPINTLRIVVRKTRAIAQSAFLAHPKRVECNVCGWQGRHFLGDAWHKRINCPRCRSGIRQRLFFAALEHLSDHSIGKLFSGKRVLHFAPEPAVATRIQSWSDQYHSADFIREDCDLRLDMCNLAGISDASYDVVVAFDVLEHVPDTVKALDEVRRVLSTRGVGIFTVPQKDGLSTTYEDPSILTAAGRESHFGQHDHLRIFGLDFAQVVAYRGFSVAAVDETDFSTKVQLKNVLFPPKMSVHPLATNHRKVYFCTKDTDVLGRL